VHRDIKPQNVIVCDDPRTGRATLMDFGIARLAGAPTLTAAGEVIGTLAYMSPEQAEGELAGPPTDVYSLALTAYECWTGENPVAGSSPAQTARRIGTGIEPLRNLRPDLPEGLADTIDACLDPDPDLRPTPAELRECLEAELPGLDTTYPLEPADGDEEDAEREPFVVRSIGATLLCVAAAPLLGAVGLGNAASALGAVGRTALGRALLGALAWIAMVLAGSSQTEVLTTAESLLGAAVFAAAAALLGWVVRARHLALALLGAMLWAAAVDGALALVGDGALGGSPSGVVIAALAAVALEFGLVRGVAERRPVATARARALSGRLA
jgi:serine/threonine-protein kinase